MLDVFAREVLGCRDADPNLPLRPEIVGIGVSDQAIHADHFSRTTTYVNTWFHQQPHRDLMRPETFGADRYDYVTCSEVLEHVDQPAEAALQTIFGVLRPGGVVVLTTPTARGRTIEHYPPLTERRVVATATGWRLQGIGPDGAAFVSDSVLFHGGPGETVEMRVWGSESLHEALAAAGFQDIRQHLSDVPELGIEWSGIPESMSVPGGVARGLRSGVWTARRPNGEQG